MSTLALLPHPDSRPICSGHSTSWNSAMKETHYSRHTHPINEPIYYILLTLKSHLSIIIHCADQDQRPVHIIAIHVRPYLQYPYTREDLLRCNLQNVLDKHIICVTPGFQSIPAKHVICVTPELESTLVKQKQPETNTNSQ